MFIVIEHEIHDPEAFQVCAERVIPLPEGLHLHHFLPAPDLSCAWCLYEARSVRQLSDHIDGTLEDASAQRYFPVDEQHAIGLAERKLS